jgi:CRP-like cAMP-binding protein
MEDGRIAEVGTIGNEGMAGLPVFLGAETTPTLAFQQVPGEALRMRVDAFREEVRNDGALTRVLHRYTQALLTQVAQAAACNRLHSIGQRCACWLLMTQDRVGTDEFELTHEFLGQMLGVRRATVTEVAGTLQEAGLITYSRGKITVLDCQGLEAASCECYQVIREEFNRLLR